MKIQTKNQCGVTLIELVQILVAVIMIYVLADLAVPGFQKARPKACQRACDANMKTLAGALKMYNLDFHTDCVLEGCGDSGKTHVTYSTMKERGYLQSIPMHPGTNEPPEKVYRMDENGVIYCKSKTNDYKNYVHGYIKKADASGVKQPSKP